MRCGYRTARFQILITLFEILKSPFGRVRFRDFFFADIITSSVTTMQDIGVIVYFIRSGNFWERNYSGPSSNSLWFYLAMCTILPFWWRFLQCWNKWFYTGLRAHLINAGKYFSKIVPACILVGMIHSNKVDGDGFWLYFCTNMAATTYCIAWDYYMDWGIFRSWEKDTYLLRTRLTFKPWFYYFAILTNFMLRYVWIAGLFVTSKTNTSKHLLASLLAIAEIVRRTQWALLRVENEFYNNFE